MSIELKLTPHLVDDLIDLVHRHRLSLRSLGYNACHRMWRDTFEV